MEPLKHLTCVKEENGNRGREFVKCLSKPQPGQVLKKCGHFEWLDGYVERVKIDQRVNTRPQFQFWGAAWCGTHLTFGGQSRSDDGQC
uniref:Uncharacterized protein n=1 Tax=Aegilops tauschii TaxID=37682 RepID=M8B957_AEGTA